MVTLLAFNMSKINNWELATNNSRVLWPLQTEQERKDIKTLVKLFGVKICYVKNNISEHSPKIHKSGTVVAFGKDCFALAQLYAHLTERFATYVNSIKDLQNIKEVELVITLSSKINIDLLNTLYVKLNPKKAPGIIFGNDYIELRRQILLKSASLYLCNFYNSNTRIDINTALLNSNIITKNRILLGADCNNSDLKYFLSKRVKLLYINAHSTALDANLGSLILCPLKGKNINEISLPEPFCLVNKFCNRLGMNIDNALKSKKIISPNDIKALIVVFNGCHSSSIQSTPLMNGSWSFSNLMMNNPYIGNYIGNWKVIISDFFKTDEMITEIDSGVEIGIAVGRFNLKCSEKGKNAHFCVFGDPRLVVKILKDKNNFTPLLRPDSSKIKTSKQKTDALNLLYVIITDLSLKLKGRYKTKLTTATKNINEYLNFSKNQAKLHFINKIQHVNNIFASYCFFREMNLLNDWIKYSHDYIVKHETIICDCCGSLTKSLLFNLTDFRPCKRKIINCPLCGIIQDGIEEMKLIEIGLKENQKVTIKSELESKNILFLQIGIGMVKNREFKSWNINLSKDRILLNSEFKIPRQSIIKGPTFIGIVLIYNNNFILRKRPIRGEWLR